MTPGITLRTNFASNRMARYTPMLANWAAHRAQLETRSGCGIPENMVRGVLQMFIRTVDIQVIDKLTNKENLKPPAFSLHPESVVYA
jgi:hypothetical protein